MAKIRTIFKQHPANQNTGNGPTPAKSDKDAVLPVLSTADAKKFGLENFGNTCYANSVIQALYFCAPFRDLVVQAIEVPHPPNQTIHSATSSSPTLGTPSTSGTTSVPPIDSIPYSPSKPPISTTPIPIPPHPPTLFSALRSLYAHISTNPAERGTVAPRAFIDKLKEVNEIFRSTTMHQDAHEFLNFLLNKIVEEIEEDKRSVQQAKEKESLVNVDDLSNSVTTSSTSGISPHDATLVHKLFEGVLTSETRCLTCETVSSRDESFLDLSIDIEQNSSVTACLRQFSASEMLCQKNKFFCDSCCDLQEAEKRMKIKRLPNVLALHLKRFKYQEDLQKYVKLAYRVAFPFELRLFNTVDDAEDADRLYELFGIVVHIGNGPHHGHYISIIKTLGSWLVFDDVTVSPIAEADIPKYFGDPAGSSSPNSGSAYVLYYQAIDIDLVGLGLKEPEPEPAPVTRGVVVEQPVGLGVTLDGTVSGGSVEESPALPPGLSVEVSAVSTPEGSTSIPLPPPALQLDTTALDKPVPNGVASSMSPPKTGMSNFMSSIRRSGSQSGYAEPGRNGIDGRQHGLDLSPRPTNGVAGSDEEIGTVPEADESDQKSDQKEKRKEPEKKGKWLFNRRSIRLGDRDKDKDKEKNGRHGHGASASEYNAPSGVPDPSPSSGHWFKTSGHSKPPRRPSEPVSFFNPSHFGSDPMHSNGHNTLNHTQNGLTPDSSYTNGSEPQDPSPKTSKARPKTSTGASLAMTEINGDLTNGYDSAKSTSSSHLSTPLSSSPQPITGSRSMDPQLASSSSSPNGRESWHPRPLPPVPRSPDHKKSLTHLPSMTKDILRGLPSIPRPSTAGGRPSSKYSAEPPVPSPALPAAYANHSRAKSNGYNSGSQHDPDATMKGKDRDNSNYTPGLRTSAALDDVASPNFVMSSPENALASTATVGSGSSSASSNLKKATRKLSLGFGRRDREERHREKDIRDREKLKEKTKDPTLFPGLSPRF
ncbi:hypothetical protein PTI98_000668 [Pleurotus ostreatus]|nr:hypothetical protein PTI98_000668 [Pleurotus ostreatus]